MHNLLRHAAQHEAINSFPSMGAEHDEVVALSHFTYGLDGITHADIGRHREVYAGQRLGHVVHDLFSIPLTLLRPAFEFYHQLFAHIVEGGHDREDGDCDG